LCIPRGKNVNGELDWIAEDEHFAGDLIYRTARTLLVTGRAALKGTKDPFFSQSLQLQPQRNAQELGIDSGFKLTPVELDPFYHGSAGWTPPVLAEIDDAIANAVDPEERAMLQGLRNDGNPELVLQRGMEKAIALRRERIDAAERLIDEAKIALDDRLEEQRCRLIPHQVRALERTIEDRLTESSKAAKIDLPSFDLKELRGHCKGLKGVGIYVGKALKSKNGRPLQHKDRLAVHDALGLCLLDFVDALDHYLDAHSTVHDLSDDELRALQINAPKDVKRVLERNPGRPLSNKDDAMTWATTVAPRMWRDLLSERKDGLLAFRKRLNDKVIRRFSTRYQALKSRKDPQALKAVLEDLFVAQDNNAWRELQNLSETLEALEQTP
jgi:hypothetical protein